MGKKIRKIKIFFKSNLDKFSKFFKNKLQKFIKFLKSIEGLKENSNYLIKLSLIAITYGFMIDFALWELFGYKFSLFRAIALGISFYFISMEAPRMIKSCFPERRYSK